MYCDKKCDDRFIIKDTEKQNNVCLGDKLGLTATVDITLKQTFYQCSGNLHNALYSVRGYIVNNLHLSYNLASTGVLVRVRRSSDVVPHLSRRHDQDKTLKYTDQYKRRNILF